MRTIIVAFVCVYLLFDTGILLAQKNNEVGFKTEVINGEYVGGLKNGKPYYIGNIPKRGYIVKSKNDLIESLKKAKSGQVIYVQDDLSINLTDVKKLVIPEGVTLASGRGKNGSKGALIFTNTNGTAPLFITGGANVTIIGLRIKGPDMGIYANGKDAFAGKSSTEKKNNRLKLYKQNMYGVPISEGILNGCSNFEVKNCEIFGWTHAAVKIIDGGDGSKVFNNYIHHNQRFGLGYGVVVDGATAKIQGNLFDYNRHSVAGTGRMGSGYEVSYNKFMENNNTSWAIDMHGGVDRNDGTDLAGSKLIVNNNIIRLKGKALAFVIRGVPSDEAQVFNNDIIYVDQNRVASKVSSLKANSQGKGSEPLECIQQRNAKGRFSAFNNRVNIN